MFYVWRTHLIFSRASLELFGKDCGVFGKVAMYRHVYRAEPKEQTQFGSVSGSEIPNLPFYHSGIVSLYWSEPKEPT